MASNEMQKSSSDKEPKTLPPPPPSQHVMPPYGTPPHPYVTMYPPGGMYGHPSVPQGDTSEGDATKQSEVKEKLPIKRSRGSLGSLNMITGKNSGASANGAYSKSGESASDGSSEGSDANTQNHLESCLSRQRRKQSNRESARRSRLRKQAECDELAQRAEVLNEENASLREEINKLRSQCEELTSENTSLNSRTNFYHSIHLKALTWTRTSKNHQTPIKQASQRQRLIPTKTRSEKREHQNQFLTQCKSSSSNNNNPRRFFANRWL
ncbi:hypothetical protein Bca4012_033956 [Brassica carinata]